MPLKKTQESNAWVQEIIAKIREILSTFQQQYKSVAIPKNSPTIPGIDDPNFEYFFEHLSESYA